MNDLVEKYRKKYLEELKKEQSKNKKKAIWEIICPNCESKKDNINIKKTTQWNTKYWSCTCKKCNHYWLDKRNNLIKRRLK
jgi:hypothetical protein